MIPIFISSVQKEFSAERRAVRDFIQGDPLLRRFFDVFLFEDLPASDRRADEVYLDQAVRCPVYVGFFGDDYGSQDAGGPSPTEREFNAATSAGRTRLIFVKGQTDASRSPEMLALIRKAGEQLIRRRFTGIADLNAALYASNASAQVMLFSDRLEVWNPGELPPAADHRATPLCPRIDPAQPAHCRPHVPGPLRGKGRKRHPRHDGALP